LTHFPPGLSYSFGVGIGLFLAFIGLNESGIVTVGVAGALVRLGNLGTPSAEIAVLSFVLIAVLMLRRVPGAILLGILIYAAIAFATGVAKPPTSWISMPPNPAPIMLKLDLHGALSVGFFGVLLSIFVMALVDTMGSLIGVSARAGFLDADGSLPQIERPMLADALATMFAGLAGTTTAGAYIRVGGAGWRAHRPDRGRRRGAVRRVALLCSAGCGDPVSLVCPSAYHRGLDDDHAGAENRLRRLYGTDSRIQVIALMSFTYNIGVGITAGLVLYPFFKLAAGRWREIHAGLWMLCGLSILFYIFYPYQ
jgi:AGZA family xanthine/uracil permease-like MFS transporter